MSYYSRDILLNISMFVIYLVNQYSYFGFKSSMSAPILDWDNTSGIVSRLDHSCSHVRYSSYTFSVSAISYNNNSSVLARGGVGSD